MGLLDILWSDGVYSVEVFLCTTRITSWCRILLPVVLVFAHTVSTGYLRVYERPDMIDFLLERNV